MKDAKGHGSNSRGAGGPRPIPHSPYHAKSDAELRYIMRDASEARANMQGIGNSQAENKYADQVNDAATVLGYRQRGGLSDHPNDVAARALSSGGPKSEPAPVHSAMSRIGGPQGYARDYPAPGADDGDDYYNYNPRP